MDSVLLAETVLYTLLGGTVYDWHQGSIPQGEAKPAGVFQLYTPGEDMLVQSDLHLASNLQFIVKGVALGEDAAPASAIAEAARTVLHGYQGVHEAHIVDIHRLAPISVDEVDGDRHYRHRGGRYRVILRPENL